ncbi:transcriptional regulator FtrA [Thalassobaculum fulvum]|uniref:Transcriptional regulator FtrA n=1 Tax=Thalassobaculum fulvum TaxID=1633335 RepID=A0A918XV76_9PROT|nr:transcriptional regulator FtrA [Thalassobaculum fulvum]GHD55373.1 transcriptional regulator FtrA [Thalassobaculum fulvum]
MPKGAHPGPDPRSVAVLAYDGLCTFEFGQVVEVFGLPRPEMGDDWYRFRVCAERPGPLRAIGGFRVEAGGGLAELGAAATIVVPGWRGIDAPVPDDLLETLWAAHARGSRLVSICSGAAVLAATGLLDGRRCTTHWRHAEKLAARFPAVRVDADVLYTEADRVFTSAGSAAGLDLCVHLVRRDFGPRIANEVGRRLVLPPHREGGQAQFIARPVADRENGRFAALFDWARDRLGERISVDRMAAEAAMSRRSFVRRFEAATGTTPGEWLIGERVRRASDLLETTGLGVERVATECGFGSAEALRHHFRTRLGISPTAYRRQFARVGAR